MVRLLKQQCVRGPCFVGSAMEFFVELGFGFLLAILLEPILKSVANDAQQPGTAVPASEPAEELERSQVGFLDDVLGVRVISR
jgi:hypothetical protein